MLFPHRQNPDGCVDSICPHCFITIASATEEADLQRAENAHVCEPARIAFFEPRTAMACGTPSSPIPASPKREVIARL